MHSTCTYDSVRVGEREVMSENAPCVMLELNAQSCLPALISASVQESFRFFVAIESQATISPTVAIVGTTAASVIQTQRRAACAAHRFSDLDLLHTHLLHAQGCRKKVGIQRRRRSCVRIRGLRRSKRCPKPSTFQNWWSSIWITASGHAGARCTAFEMLQRSFLNRWPC